MKNINLKAACELAQRIKEQKKMFAFYHSVHDVASGDREQDSLDSLRDQLHIDKGYLALSAVLDDVQKPTKVRMIDAEDIIRHLCAISDNLNIPKKAMEGITIRADLNAQKFPNAYKGRPESTIFEAEYKAGGWRVTSVARSESVQRNHGTSITLTDDAKAALLLRFSEF